MKPYIVIPPHSSDLYELPPGVIDKPIRVIYEGRGIFRAIEGSKRLRALHELGQHVPIKLVKLENKIPDHDISNRMGQILSVAQILAIIEANPSKRMFYVFGEGPEQKTQMVNLKYLEIVAKSIDDRD